MIVYTLWCLVWSDHYISDLYPLRWQFVVADGCKDPRRHAVLYCTLWCQHSFINCFAPILMCVYIYMCIDPMTHSKKNTQGWPSRNWVLTGRFFAGATPDLLDFAMSMLWEDLAHAPTIAVVQWNIIGGVPKLIGCSKPIFYSGTFWRRLKKGFGINIHLQGIFVYTDGYIYIYTQFSTSQDGWMELMYTCMIFGWPHTSTKNCNRVTRRPFKLPSRGTYSDFPLLPLCFDGNPQMSHWNTTCINLVSELVLSLEQPGLDAKSFHAETSASSLAQSHIYTCSLLREQVQLHISKNTRIILSFSKIGILNLTAERKPHVHIYILYVYKEKNISFLLHFTLSLHVSIGHPKKFWLYANFATPCSLSLLVSHLTKSLCPRTLQWICKCPHRSWWWVRTIGCIHLLRKLLDLRRQGTRAGKEWDSHACWAEKRFK